jgi:hypothetical protein
MMERFSMKSMSAIRWLLAGGLVLSAPPGARAQVSEESWFPGSSSISEPEVIPPAYRGAWAPNRAACDDQDGVDRMVVYPNGVDTYESGGRLQRVTQAGQERSIKLKLAYEGEGDFWDTVETWTLDATGRRLEIAVAGRPGPETLIRCR